MEREMCANPFQEEKQAASVISTVLDPNESMRVECDTIDNILRDLGVSQVHFIRIQINGAEVEALEGMTETLKKGPTLLIAAGYERGGKRSYEEVIPILHENGYSTVRKGGHVFAWKG